MTLENYLDITRDKVREVIRSYEEIEELDLDYEIAEKIVNEIESEIAWLTR